MAEQIKILYRRLECLSYRDLIKGTLDSLKSVFLVFCRKPSLDAPATRGKILYSKHSVYYFSIYVHQSAGPYGIISGYVHTTATNFRSAENFKSVCLGVPFTRNYLNRTKS